MTKLFELPAKYEEECPEEARKMVLKKPPNLLYKLISTGQRVYITAYCEDNTVKVSITGEFNLISFEREVFGIELEDLEECDLPPAGEPLGVTQTEEETERLIAALRALHELRGVLQ